MDKYTRTQYNCRNNNLDRRSDSTTISGCNALKKRFMEVEFGITETVLYLDAYPESAEALNHYHRLLEERELLIQTLHSQCGPMTHFGNVSKESWQWTKGPWPWKYEAN